MYNSLSLSPTPPIRKQDAKIANFENLPPPFSLQTERLDISIGSQTVKSESNNLDFCSLEEQKKEKNQGL
jgi:hypothetical protein